MKKGIYLGLVACLLFSSIANPVAPMVYAQNLTEASDTNALEKGQPNSADQDNLESAESTVSESTANAEKSTESNNEKDSKDTGTSTIINEPDKLPGKITVNLGSSASQQTDLTIDLKLTKEEAEVQQQSVVLKKYQDGANTQTSLTFDRLEPGTYTLVMNAKGYQSYTQELTVGKDEKKILVYTDFIDGYNYEAASAHPGVLKKKNVYKIDFNDDKVIDAQDEKRIIDALQEKRTDDVFDINQDGNVDLLDLQEFSLQWEQWEQEQVNAQKDYLSSIESRIPVDTLKITSELESVIKGDIENLTQEEGSVTVAPANDQAISNDNPVELSFDIQSQEMQMLVLNTNLTDNAIEQGTVRVELEDGSIQEFQLTSDPTARSAAIIRDDEGNFTLDLGKQIAVKKVTIRITKTSGNTNLAEISKVEFLNDTANRIPEPDMSIPEAIEITNASNSFVVTWKNVTNVAGYEVIISADNKEEVIKTDSNFLLVKTFGGKKLVNKKEYGVKVRSINGEWKSPNSPLLTAIPVADKKPDRPDNVTVKGAFKALNVSWKSMEDTDSYSVFYKEQGAEEFIQFGKSITNNSVQITDLKDNTTYQVYVIGHNDLGDSPPSLTAEGKTENIQPATLPNYKVINRSTGEGQLSEHIESITLSRGRMVSSPLDQGSSTSAFGLVDNSYSSYLQVDDWDEGGAYPGWNKGVIVKFDQKYTMNRIMLAEVSDIGSYSYVNVKYVDEGGKEQDVPTSISRKIDSNKRSYYELKFDKAITTDQLRIGIGRYGSSPQKVIIAEMKFYHYDSLEDEINALFADSLHLELKPNVSSGIIQQLQERLDTKDEVSGEYIMDREELQKELDMARAILEDQQKGEVLAIDSTITAKKDGHLGFTGLNAWQPLGVSAAAGEKITIYVGSPTGKVGDKTPLSLIPTQYYAESSSLTGQSYELKIGKNEITIPQISSLTAEKGGALYIAYSGNNTNDRYSVRVSGGTKIPVLNLHNVTDEQQRLELTKAYIEQLTLAVEKLKDAHAQSHEGEYVLKECITNATDIQLQYMMLSIPASQVLTGIGSGSTEEQAQRLLQSLDAMDQMMTLFYQHKGLSNDEAAGNTNKLPAQHLNIRYMRMFAGAFMYAAGNHIGIEWNETVGMTKGVPLKTENGKYVSGQLFGWGIGHEIGHNINQSNYAIAEITNNYFAQLSSARDTNESVRWDYDVIFEKTTSNTIGQSSDVFVQLAMYWQLKLAYDKNYSFKLFDNYTEQLNNLFFARVDTYSRNPASAPAPKGITLSLNAGAEQNFIRLASAAAQKDLTNFFTRWGLVPTKETKQYIEQFEPEMRAIYYGDDDAHTYMIEKDAELVSNNWSIASESSTVTIDNTYPNRVHLSIKDNLTEEQKADLHGYEIIRKMVENGAETKEVVGFTRVPEYTDVVSTINNRVIGYEVRIVDKALNYSDAVTIGSVKITSDGSHEKTNWQVTTNMVSEDDEQKDVCEDNPDDSQVISAIKRVIDNEKKTIYTGSSQQKDAEIVIDFRKTLDVTALKFTGTEQMELSDFDIQISENGTTWKTVKEGSFEKNTSTPQTVYFANESSDKFVGTYDARYVKLRFKDSVNKNVSINELDILGPSGDNIELSIDQEQPAIGVLKADYIYDSQQGYKIPEGSLIFTGKYKGHPAFNVVLLYDQDGNIVGGFDEEGILQADQIILADIPEQGNLGETSDGTFIYWIEPGKWSNEQLPSKVRAELYRVDNAETNEGQRLVSDTTFVQIPTELPDIEIK